MRAAIVAALLLLAMTPAADAGGASGSFSAASVNVPADDAFTMAMAALYVRELAPGTMLTGTAARVLVERYEFVEDGASTISVAVENRSATYPLTNVQLALVGEPSGFLALARTGAHVATTWSLATSTHIIAQTRGTLGNAPTTNGRPSDAASPGFGVIIDTPHLRLDAAGVVRIEGDLGLKLRGSTLQLAARENTTDVTTGEAPDPMVPTRSVDRWVYLNIEDASLELTLPQTAAIAAWQGQLQLDGSSLVLGDALGELSEGGRTYAADHESATFSGALDALLRPDATALDGRILVDLDGDLGSASLSPSGSAWAPVAKGPAWGLFLVGLVGVVAAATLVVGAKRKRDVRALTVEQLVDLAAEAAEGGRHADALDWTLAAQQRSPRSVRLLTDEGFLRSALGDTAGALAAYDRAATLDDAGEGDFLAAVLLVEQGNEDGAAVHLLRALRKAPSLAYEVVDDASFGQLARRPDVAAGVREALSRAR